MCVHACLDMSGHLYVTSYMQSLEDNLESQTSPPTLRQALLMFAATHAAGLSDPREASGSALRPAGGALRLQTHTVASSFVWVLRIRTQAPVLVRPFIHGAISAASEEFLCG